MSERGVASQSRRRSVSGALALSLVLAAASPAAGAELYGLVIGVDDYVGTANDLDGAVNDANDVAQALDRLGAREVIRLVNEDASKDRIVAGWGALLAKAKAGDTIVFSYAGHGSQEPEPPGRHGEADGRNENFLLGAYQPSGPGTRERIVDDEIFEWMKQADDKRVRVVLVADSCHSGGMERSASAAGVSRRHKARFQETAVHRARQLSRLPHEADRGRGSREDRRGPERQRQRGRQVRRKAGGRGRSAGRAHRYPVAHGDQARGQIDPRGGPALAPGAR
ncbi:MAG: caspase family protein [Methyloceanibacter sp.]|nr:caspase family protein [Methyloceanibacter sp.]